jgi:NCAIR mutase (PurE)-related protein
LFAAADGVLYDAKRSGRDRVVRLSGVTQTRAPATPVDALFGPAPVAEPVEGTPVDDDGFAPLLADPPLGVDRPDEPLLGPLPGTTTVTPPVTPTATPPTVPGVATSIPLPTPAAAVEPEVVWGAGRTTAEVLALVRESRREHPDRPTVVLRAAPETLVALAAEHDAYTTMDAVAMAAAVGPVPEPVGRVGIVAGAAGPVAAEAAFVARVAGTEAVRVDAGGSARLRSLLADRSQLPDVDCLVVVAGADTGLATVLGALTDVPVLAVPTSDGRPGGLAGLGAVLGLLGSPAPGVAVGAMDDGWSAGVFAARIARRAGHR